MKDFFLEDEMVQNPKKEKPEFPEKGVELSENDLLVGKNGVSVDAFTIDGVFEKDLRSETMHQKEDTLAERRGRSLKTNSPDGNSSEQLGRLLENIIASSAQNSKDRAMPALIDQIVSKIKEKT